MDHLSSSLRQKYSPYQILVYNQMSVRERMITLCVVQGVIYMLRVRFPSRLTTYEESSNNRSGDNNDAGTV